MPSMKAVFVGKNVREIRDYEIPTPGPGEILIKSEFLFFAPIRNQTSLLFFADMRTTFSTSIGN